MFKNTELFVQKRWNICSEILKYLLRSICWWEGARLCKAQSPWAGKSPQWHTLYLSQIPQIYLWRTNLSMTNCHEGNSRFLCMTDMEKSDISSHLVCFWCGEYICTISAVLLYNLVCRELHCFFLLAIRHNLRTCMWRQFKPKISYVKKKKNKYDVCSVVVHRNMHQNPTRTHRLQLSTYSFKIRTYHLYLKFC